MGKMLSLISCYTWLVIRFMEISYNRFELYDDSCEQSGGKDHFKILFVTPYHTYVTTKIIGKILIYFGVYIL